MAEVPKTIVITGVTSGLGLALTRWFLREGHTVHGCGRRENPLAEEATKNFFFTQLDIMSVTDCRSWADMICAATEPDILVHNAAAIHANAQFAKIDRDELITTIDVNVLGSFNVLQPFVPQMNEAGKGIIVTLSSGAGRMGIPGIAGYCASKWAVEGLTKTLAAELPDPLAAIPLSPGMVDTAMLRRNFGEAASEHQKPEDWATRAGPMILGFTREHNGQSLTVPEA